MGGEEPELEWGAGKALRDGRRGGAAVDGFHRPQILEDARDGPFPLRVVDVRDAASDWWPRLRVRSSRGAETAAESAVDDQMFPIEEMPSEVTELKAPVA